MNHSFLGYLASIMIFAEHCSHPGLYSKEQKATLIGLGVGGWVVLLMFVLTLF